MLLKKIKLHNIRSYTQQEVEFSDGSLLLSGDIGSGKSSILLGIEFALFGSKSAELPASSLLRNGANEGSVELYFELEGREIIIKRYLKRAKQTIKQETGYIVINGTKKELSPVEMKAEIFELLGYPLDLVSKNKDLIYRYTVYTPQEELKRILFEDKDTRLNTLRKVFNIDRYKRIKENAAIFNRALKEKSRELAGFISDLEDKKKDFEKQTTEALALREKAEQIVPKIEDAKLNVSKKKEAITVFESKMKESSEFKNEYRLQEQVISQMLEQRTVAKSSVERIDGQVAELQKEISTHIEQDMAALSSKVESVTTQIANLRSQLDVSKQKVHECNLIKNQSQELIQKVTTLEDCPLCLQTVEDEHKQSIVVSEQQKMSTANAQLREHTTLSDEMVQKISDSEKQLEELRKKQMSNELVELKKKSILEKNEEKKALEGKIEDTKQQIAKASTIKLELQEKINALKDVEEQYGNAKNELDEAQKREQELIVSKTAIDKELEACQNVIERLMKEINTKEESRKQLTRYVEYQGWVSDFFVNLMGTIERHVMLQVHREFNELFKEWFNLLIEDETIAVRIDDEFTPVVEQNGYETAIDNLSGGEKTAVALSYRLALNKVINDVISGIKTKDILVLDEPTDGFSTEQLDKVRDILNQLNMKQVILVSHESKIESFVDSVVRIGKEGHESGVVE